MFVVTGCTDDWMLNALVFQALGGITCGRAAWALLEACWYHIERWMSKLMLAYCTVLQPV